jgi:hypothetical protein
MAKNSTITTVANGADVLDTWGNLVKTSVEAVFADKKLYTQAYASPLNFDLDNGSLQIVTLTGSATITISNQEIGRAFTLIFLQDGTGSRTPTFFSTIKWPSNVVPDFTTAGNSYDSFTFLPIANDGGNWTYLGFIVGLGV